MKNTLGERCGGGCDFTKHDVAEIRFVHCVCAIVARKGHTIILRNVSYCGDMCHQSHSWSRRSRPQPGPKGLCKAPEAASLHKMPHKSARVALSVQCTGLCGMHTVWDDFRGDKT